MARSRTLAEATTGELMTLPISALVGHPRNRPYSQTCEEFQALVRSIGEKGILVPLIVRPRLDGDGHPSGYQILAGHRRFSAGVSAGLTAVPAIVRSLDDREALEFVTFENLERENPDPLSEAAGIAALIELGWDTEAIASRCGRSPAWVARRRSLTGLIEPLRALAADPEQPLHSKPVTWLEELARLPAETQTRIHEELFGDLSPDDAWQDRSLEDFETLADLRSWIAREHLSELRRVPWKLDDETLYPDAGACAACPKRSSCSPLLFEDLAGDAKADPHDRCLDAVCYREKMQRHVARTVAEAREKHPNLVVVGDYGECRKTKLAEAIGTKVLDKYSFESCKKSDPAAVPVINVAKAGGVQWMKPHEWAKTTVARAARTKTQDGRTVTPLAERRKALEARRSAHVVEAVRGRLDAMAEGQAALPDCVRNVKSVMSLALVFGTARRIADDMVGDEWKSLSSLDPKGPDELVDLLLRDVIPCIQSLLVFHNTAMAADVFKDHVPAICRLLDIDLKALVAAAVEAIPEPKAWAGLKADGTPKGKAKARKKAE